MGSIRIGASEGLCSRPTLCYVRKNGECYPFNLADIPKLSADSVNRIKLVIRDAALNVQPDATASKAVGRNSWYQVIPSAGNAIVQYGVGAASYIAFGKISEAISQNRTVPAEESESNTIEDTLFNRGFQMASLAVLASLTALNLFSQRRQTAPLLKEFHAELKQHSAFLKVHAVEILKGINHKTQYLTKLMQPVQQNHIVSSNHPSKNLQSVELDLQGWMTAKFELERVVDFHNQLKGKTVIDLKRNPTPPSETPDKQEDNIEAKGAIDPIIDVSLNDLDQASEALDALLNTD